MGRIKQALHAIFLRVDAGFEAAFGPRLNPLTQLGTLGHVSNFFGTPTQIALAERLLALAEAPEGSRVFFTNSGTEANEAAFKMTRRTGRSRVLALVGGFHGRTMGALALTSKAAYREPFEPLPGGVEFVAFDDVTALEDAFSPGAVAEPA